MKIKIERIPYAQLRNDEYPLVVVQIIDICRKYDMSGYHLDKSFAELSSYRVPLDGLTVSVRKNEKLTRLGKLDVERDTLVNVLSKVTNDFEDVDLPEIRFHYDTLNTLLDKHKAKTIARAARTAETERLQLLETDLTANSAVQEALTAFGLQPVARRLFEANKEYEALFREYIAEKSAEEHIDVTALRSTSGKALTQFLDAVQYCAFNYEEIDYLPLVNELKQLAAYYIKQLKARATRRKNGIKTDVEPSITPEN
jgi:hypothetical protein